jgi:S-adenosylmethionine synthetase
LERIVREVFDLTPKGIIDALGLKRPIYQATAAYGHFGRKPYTHKIGGKSVRLFPWEEINRVQDLLSAAR